MLKRPRIVLLAFDGFPLDLFRPAMTPRLWQLGQDGGIAPQGGRTGLPSTTYPGFTSLLTGAGQWSHGVRTTAQRPGAVPGWAGANRTAVPTIMHAARDVGLRTAVVMGDHQLQRVMVLDDFDTAWPPAGIVPDGTELDAHGYPTNAALRSHLLEAASDPSVDLLFVHLNETDTLGHDLGPNAPATARCVRSADALVGELLDALAPDWERTVVAVTSDHDMVLRLPFPTIDPMASRDCAGLADDWIADGCAAWLRLTPGADPHMAIDRFSAMHGVAAWRWHEPNILLLLAAPGRIFAQPYVPITGIHGSLDTARTLAIVGGGHPAVDELGARIRDVAPRLRDWAPTLARILEIELPDAEGTDLLEPMASRAAG